MVDYKYIIDTNIVIDFFKGEEKAVKFILDHHHEIAIPIIVVGELLYGVENSSNKIKHREQVESFIQNFTIIYLNQIEYSNNYAKIKTFLKKEGKPIPENDIWIFSFNEEGTIFVTNDKHFNQLKKEGFNIINLKDA